MSKKMNAVENDKFMGALEMGDTDGLLKIVEKHHPTPKELKKKKSTAGIIRGAFEPLGGAGGNGYMPQYIGTVSGYQGNPTLSNMALGLQQALQQGNIDKAQYLRQQQIAQEMRAQAEKYREESLRMASALNDLRAQRDESRMRELATKHQFKTPAKSDREQKLEKAVARLALMVATFALKNNDHDAADLAQVILKEVNEA